MINVIYSKKQNDINFIKVSGHANYDISGQDIVCSAVSMLCYAIGNKIINLDENFNLIVEANKFEFNNNSNNNNINLLLETLLEGLYLVEDQYSKNIKIKEEHYD